MQPQAIAHDTGYIDSPALGPALLRLTRTSAQAYLDASAANRPAPKWVEGIALAIAFTAPLLLIPSALARGMFPDLFPPLLDAVLPVAAVSLIVTAAALAVGIYIRNARYNTKYQDLRKDAGTTLPLLMRTYPGGPLNAHAARAVCLDAAQHVTPEVRDHLMHLIATGGHVAAQEEVDLLVADALAEHRAG